MTVLAEALAPPCAPHEHKPRLFDDPTTKAGGGAPSGARTSHQPLSSSVRIRWCILQTHVRHVILV